MARSALIIGLGGTGQWIATYIKRDLLASHDGIMPSNVRILSFDTMLEQEARVGKRSGEEDIQIGSVTLNFNTEFIPLADDVHDLSEQIRDGKHRQIGNWFPAKYWLTLPRSNFILKNGAGQLRQFGRLAVFNDLIRGTGRSDIWRSLLQALSDIGAVAGQQTIEIFVVGSFAGGTGSGMFIDMAWLARQAAQIGSKQAVTIRGYFVLPGAFTQKDQDKAMLARSFAAWRELNRFMTLNEDEGLPKLIFDPDEDDLNIGLRKRVFDACYLVDSIRGDETVPVNPRNYIFPAVADAISSVLDEKGGARYTDYVLKNLGPKYMNERGRPMYSAIGTFSYKVPVHYLRQEFAHAFTKQALTQLLGLHKIPGSENLLLANTNPELGNQIGFNSSLGILNADEQRYLSGEQEQVAYGNLFTKKVATIAQGGGVRNAQLLQDQVNAFLSREGLKANWADPFTNFGNDATAVEVQKRVKSEINFRLADHVTAEPQKIGTGFFSSKEKPVDVIARISDPIEKLMWEHYGGQLAAGGEFTGKLGEALDEAQAYQLDNYRRLLRIWLLRTLMGESQTDYVKARSNKLGYAISYVSGLVAHLGTAIEFMNEVQVRVTAAKPALTLQERKGKRQTIMQQEASNRFLWWPHPKAYQNITDYMRASQDVAYARRESITHRAVLETIEQMQRYTILVKDELERWAKLLFNGDLTLNIPGLYLEVDKNLNAVRADHTTEQDLAKADVQSLLQDRVPDVSPEALQSFMRGIQWGVEAGPDHFHLQLTIEPLAEKGVTLQRLAERTTKASASSLTQRNLREVLGMGLNRYPVAVDQIQRVSTLLQQEYPEVAKLMTNLYRHEQTLMKERPGYDRIRMRSNFIRVAQGQDENSKAYFQSLESMLRKEAKGGDSLYPIEVVDSSDLFKFTMVRTDDLLRPEFFNSWHECLKAYANEIQEQNREPSQYHIYAPEQQAIAYELRLSRLFRTDYRAFHPRVVNLLEYGDRVRQFFLGWSLGFFQRMGDQINETWWELAIPNERYRLQMTQKWRTEPDDFIFTLMNNFVLVGRDLTPGVRDWVNYKKLEETIRTSRLSLGKEGIQAKIRDQLLDRNGLIPLLTKLADIEDVPNEDGQVKQEIKYPEYQDLKDIGRLIYYEELMAFGVDIRDIEEGRI